MKNSISILLLLLQISIVGDIAFGQQSLDDSELQWGIYEGELLEYFKKSLKIYYKNERMNDPKYLSEVNDFVCSKIGTIGPLYTLSGFTISEIHFESENSDALILIEEFKKCNLFQNVVLISPIRPG